MAQLIIQQILSTAAQNLATFYILAELLSKAQQGGMELPCALWIIMQ